MTSVLNVDTIADKAGTGPVALTKQSAAKAFIDIPSGQASINTSLNVSSLDDDGTGDGGINLTSSFGSVNYSIAMGVEDGAGSTAIRAHDLTRTTKVAGGYDFETFYVNSSNNRTNTDMQSFSTMFGDLA